MSRTVANMAASEARSATAPAVKEPGEVLLTLVRREFWEHRALWMAPLVVAALLALCAAIGRVHIDVNEASDLSSQSQQVALFSIIQWVLAMPLYIVVMLVGSFYLLDCLYAERKDRSILFWKSLPVSDGLTVCAKLLVALVVMPVGAFVLALLSHAVCTAILEARVALNVWDKALSLRARRGRTEGDLHERKPGQA